MGKIPKNPAWRTVRGPVSLKESTHAVMRVTDIPDTAGDIEFSILRYKIPDIPPGADARELVAVMVPGLVENKGLNSGLAQMNTGFGAVINKEL